MSHTADGVLQAYIDGELPAERRAEVRSHLAECAACRAELSALRSAAAEFGVALQWLDGSAPRRAVPGSRPASRRAPPPPAGWRFALPRAAVVVLGLGVAGAASAAIPGSPVRDWLGGLVREPAPVAVERAAPPPESPVVAAAAEAAPEAGVSIFPEGGRIRVVLEAPSPSLLVRARLSDQERAGVYATGGAASARFRTAPGRIEVVGAGAGELVIDLPRSASEVLVEVDGDLYLVKEREQLRLLKPAADSAGSEVLFRVGS